MAAAIEVENLRKTFGRKRAIDGISLRVDRGEMVALIGASGSGKSTLIRHIAGLVSADRVPDACCISVLGQTVQWAGKPAANARRVRSRVGVVFQQFNLVSRLSVLSNVALGVLGRISPLRGALGLFTREEKLLAMQALHQVDIAGLAGQRAGTLSGGQQQRAAIARALVQQAEVLLADEPIASLDPKAARRVMEILSHVNRTMGITVLVSLHQVEYAFAYCPRTVALRDGQVIYDGPSTALTPEFLTELYGAQSEELILPTAAERKPSARAADRAVIGELAAAAAS